MTQTTTTATQTTTTAEFEAWSRPWIEASRRATDASLALRGGRRLTAEEIAAKIRASEEALLVPFTDL